MTSSARQQAIRARVLAAASLWHGFCSAKSVWTKSQPKTGEMSLAVSCEEHQAKDRCSPKASLLCKFENVYFPGILKIKAAEGGPRLF